MVSLIHLLLLVSFSSWLCLGQMVPITAPQHPNMLNVAYIPGNSTIRVERVLAPPTMTPSSTTTTTSTSTTTTTAPSTTTGPSSSIGSTPTSTTPQSTVQTTPALPPMVAPIHITFAGIRELDNSSAEVSGHSFCDFSTAVPQTPSYTADCMNLSSFLPSLNVTFSLRLCPETQNKTVNVSETIPVVAGQLLFSVSVQGWPWDQTVGKYLELNLTLGLQEGRKVTDAGAPAGQPMKLGLGVADAYAIFSTVVTGDSNTGNYVKMPAGYPKLTQFSPEGPMANVTLRLPRTTSSSVVYDTMVVEPGYTAQTKSTTVGAAPRFFQHTSTWMTTVLFLILSVFVGRF